MPPVVTVGGWSYGSYLAAALARRRPERIRGLMMVCAGLKIRPADRDLTGVLDSTPEPGWLADVPAEWHEHLGLALGHQSPDVARRVVAVLAANGPTDDAYLGTLRTEGFAICDEEIPISCDAPCLVVAGRCDRIAGYADPFRALSSFPQADYVAIASAGHYLPVEHPHRFAALARDWLLRCHPTAVGPSQ